MSGPIRMLLIEDQEADATLLKDAFLKKGANDFVIDTAVCLSQGLEFLARGTADVVLLDLFLPDSRGLETFHKLHAAAPEVPVVILTSFDDEAVAIEAVQKGAQDYLPKWGLEAHMLSRSLLYAIERHRMQNTLRSLSLVDELTGLYNRRGFLTLADQHLSLARRGKRALILLYADLDGLKQINDAHGHPVGDRALIETAQILKNVFRRSDIIARIGGDEFAIIAVEAASEGANITAALLEERLKEASLKSQLPFPLSLSVGSARRDPSETASLEQLMARADQALYERKRSKPTRHS